MTGVQRLLTRGLSRVPTERGQTEPLAALVAVALFCLGLSVYAVFVTGLAPEVGSDRALTETTGERVWGAVSEEGVYSTETDLSEALDPADLPRGYQVYSNITYTDADGTSIEPSQVQFEETGERTAATGLPEGDAFTRPVAVQHREGDIRPGMLTVVVSDGE